MKTPKPLTPQMRQGLMPRLVVLVAFLLLLYIFVPRLTGLSITRNTIQGAEWSYIWLGLLLTLLTFVVTAATYTTLALKRIGFGITFLVQIATGFTARLLPAGLGSTGLNVLYLHRAQHSFIEAGVVVVANNLSGIVGHVLLGIGVVLVGDVGWGAVRTNSPALVALIAIVLAGLAALSVTRIARFREPIKRALKDIKQSLRYYRQHPWQLLAGLGFNMLLSMVYVGILWASAKAFGVDIPIAQIFVVFTLGIVIGTATPTPGGLLGAEAGLVAGFIAYGVNNDVALAVALLYRLLTYWLPILPGFVAFLLAQRRLRLIG